MAKHIDVLSDVQQATSIDKGKRSINRQRGEKAKKRKNNATTNKKKVS